MKSADVRKLATQIAECLKERSYCLVFEADLQRYWPPEKMDCAEQEKQIQAFAHFRGWQAFVFPVESGVRAIFRKQSVNIVAANLLSVEAFD